jgi:hypothetical protein
VNVGSKDLLRSFVEYILYSVRGCGDVLSLASQYLSISDMCDSKCGDSSLYDRR